MSALASTNDVLIARMALSHVGAPTNIEALSEDTPEAEVVRTWYDISRLEVLQRFDWSFARVRRTAVADGEDPPKQGSSKLWEFRYQYPADNCIALRKIQHPSSPPLDAFPFEIELNTSREQSILTNVEDAVLVYTFNVTDPGLFSPLFVVAFSHLLGSRIAMKLTRKPAIQKSNLQDYERVITAAKAANANERVGQRPRDADWIRAMHGLGGNSVFGGEWEAFPDGQN